MKKFSLLLSMLAIAFLGNAETVTDAITATGFGAYYSSYSLLTPSSFASSAEYTGVAMTTEANGIQLTNGSKDPGYVGIITTTSGGTLKNVTVSWKSNTASGRTLNVYGSNSHFSVTSSYASQGKLIGTIVYGKSTSLDVTDSYTYVALASSSKAMYFDEIDITWETSSAPATKCTTPAIKCEGMPSTNFTFYGNAGDKKDFTLSCSTEGATLHYLVYDPANTPDFATANFLVYDEASPIQLACPGNYGIAAYATLEGYDNSDIATATVTAKEYASATSIADWISKAAASDDIFRFDCPLYVTAQSGRYLWVRDDAGDPLLVYGSIGDYYNGQQFEAGSLAGSYALYQGMAELASPTVIKPVLGADYDVPEKTLPVEMTVSQITKNDYSKFVKLKHVFFNTTDNTVVGDDAATLPFFAGRFSFTVPEDINDGYNVTGVIELYKDKAQICPISVEVSTGINDVTATQALKAQKVIENGQIYIIADGKKYNVMGAEVK
ncbi:MAG: hypothetical protein ACI307_06720 [Sodaliphilus sp.]